MHGLEAVEDDLLQLLRVRRGNKNSTVKYIYTIESKYLNPND